MADLQKFWNEYLPNKLEEHPELAAEINAVYQFDIEGFGNWVIDLTQTPGKAYEGTHEEPGCTVSAESEDFAKLLEDANAAMMLFMTGKLKVSNVGLAMSIQKILS